MTTQTPATPIGKQNLLRYFLRYSLRVMQFSKLFGKEQVKIKLNKAVNWRKLNLGELDTG